MGFLVKGVSFATCINNNSSCEIPNQVVFYIHMPQGFPRTRFLILVVNGTLHLDLR